MFLPPSYYGVPLCGTKMELVNSPMILALSLFRETQQERQDLSAAWSNVFQSVRIWQQLRSFAFSSASSQSSCLSREAPLPD